MSDENAQQRKTSHRGFASMSPERQREIASKGGKAAHKSGNAHEFNSAEAAQAGRKGGQAAHAAGTAHEFTPAEAAAAGRKGGEARSNNALNRKRKSINNNDPGAKGANLPAEAQTMQNTTEAKLEEATFDESKPI
jgi:general stress protein YciG